LLLIVFFVAIFVFGSIVDKWLCGFGRFDDTFIDAGVFGQLQICLFADMQRTVHGLRLDGWIVADSLYQRTCQSLLAIHQIGTVSVYK